ncbi:hypothetical protein HYFRA_00000214 [Hymenoscyphus fraxineus]|uniref:Saccharopine dehydrogenase NADP binding domain-containing protein n=1 Tax=Hymenoscyphus fraxineus TaxID=746836 RepID=A0A9N9PL39_9HELO|nr:hypothetical protein HYFRA_00000214 [Hymenoscyphus fraxineus]
MPPRVFFIGANGHIGGAVLELIISRHPQIPITVLMRTESKARALLSRYPSVTSKIGSLSDPEILESLANDADVVINTGPDVSFATGISSILKGLKKKKEKGYYIHTSGGALIWDKPDGSKAGEKIWDDIDDIKTLTSMPVTAVHRLEDKLVFDAHEYVNVAIISPVMVYGLSPSADHHLPLIYPHLLRAFRSLNSGFTISSGSNIWGHIHVNDLAEIYLILLSRALESLGMETGRAAPSESSKTEVWGPEAYYFASSNEVSFLGFQRSMVRALKKLGVLGNDVIAQIDIETAAKATDVTKGESPQAWARHLAESYAINMRVSPSRAKAIGWVPKDIAVQDTMEDVIAKYLESEKQN